MAELPEVYVRGWVHVANYRAGAVFGPRRLPDHEFIWLLTGSAVREVIEPNGRHHRVDLRPGLLNLSKPGVIDTYRWTTARPSSHVYVHFDLPGRNDLPSPAAWPTVLDMSEISVLKGLTRYLLDLGTDTSDAALQRARQTLSLLIQVFCTGPYGYSSSEPPWLEAVADYVGLRWAEQGVCAVPVVDLARAIGVSRGHLSSQFSRRFGCGPARTLELIRLARAAALLQQQHTVSQAAIATGFANPYYFSRRFTATYGMRPVIYRRDERQSDPYTPLRQRSMLSAAQRLLQAANP